MGQTPISDGTDPQTKDFLGFLPYGGKKRLGIDSKNMDSVLCPWTN